MIQMTWQEMQNEENPFKEKFGQAMKDGFFYLGIPEVLKKNIPYSVEYAENLRKNTELKSDNLGSPILGYKKIQGTQVVTYSALEHQWNHVFPIQILETAKAMQEVALDVLKKTLRHLSIPEDVWSAATGELTEHKGLSFFSINHYKPGKKKIGLIPHKDMGWITVLFVNKSGLERRIDENSWEAIVPKEGYFVVNFGHAFEILVGSINKLQASIHRVTKQEEERISFAIFLHSSEDTDMHKVDNNGNLIRTGSYLDYKRVCFSEFEKLQSDTSG